MPVNTPTIVTVGWNAPYETVFSVEGTSGDSPSNYALTGVTRIKGANVNIPIDASVNCLNHEEFFNQYGEKINKVIEDTSQALEALDALNIEGDPDNKVTTTLNENDLASDSATALATQKSIKSYVDNVAETLSSADGWISANENWTYSSATKITVPSGATSKYQKGDKIKLTQDDSVKYFYIIKVEDTALTIRAGNDYTLVNSAITKNYYSKVENPQGFPGYFYYNVQWKGSTTNPTIGNGVLIGKFKISGSFISITIYLRTGSTTTYGAGNYGLTYPGEWAKPPVEEDYAGATHWLTGFGYINAKCYFLGQTGAERLRCSGTKEGTCTPTYPETWKSGNILSLTSTTEFRG